ncbi:hypothetical protein ACS0TY_025451 [Phlomoides rotata]
MVQHAKNQVSSSKAFAVEMRTATRLVTKRIGLPESAYPFIDVNVKGLVKQCIYGSAVQANDDKLDHDVLVMKL